MRGFKRGIQGIGGQLLDRHHEARDLDDGNGPRRREMVAARGKKKGSNSWGPHVSDWKER
jgi:hypothetical protein